MKAGSVEAGDAELVRRARDGDHKAFRILVDRYEPLVAGTVIGMLGRGPEAEEVGQEAFVRFWKALGRFRGESSVGTYLVRIAMNQTLNHLRQRRRRAARFGPEPPGERPDPAPSPETLATEADRAAHVERAIRALPPEFRSVVVLRLVQGLSTAETAAALSVPVGTVLSRLARAQARLRGALRELL